MEALSSALAAVHPDLVRLAEGLYKTHLVSADTLVKLAASGQKQKLVKLGLTDTEAERCIELYSSGHYQSFQE